MKKCKLIDHYENYGLIGEYDAFEEAQTAADEWIQETAGECDLSCYTQCEECGKYHEIIL